MTTSTKPQSSEEIPSPNTSPLPKPAITNLTPENTLDVEEWKHRPPYQTRHRDDFGPIEWKGKCHCGKITYNLSRHRPLNAKYCHCRGCQVMHGLSLLLSWFFKLGVWGLGNRIFYYYSQGLSAADMVDSIRRTPSMGSDIPQIRSLLHERRIRAHILQLRPPFARVRDPDQGVVLFLSLAHHGRGPARVSNLSGEY